MKHYINLEDQNSTLTYMCVYLYVRMYTHIYRNMINSGIMKIIYMNIIYVKHIII